MNLQKTEDTFERFVPVDGETGHAGGGQGGSTLPDVYQMRQFEIE